MALFHASHSTGYIAWAELLVGSV